MLLELLLRITVVLDDVPHEVCQTVLRFEYWYQFLAIEREFDFFPLLALAPLCPLCGNLVDEALFEVVIEEADAPPLVD